jgi:RHS repeat-associated protein
MNIINLFLATALILNSLQGQSPAGTVPSGIYIYLNGQRVAMEENGKKSFFHNDHLGGTNVVTDETGRQVKYLEYRPFGETKVEEGILNARKKFTGKELDEETGLYNFLARFYDPKMGRFIVADPIDYSDSGIRLAGGKNLQAFLANPQNLNRYTYCLNNPLKYIDPDGLLTDLVPGIGIRKAKWSEKTAVRKELEKKGEFVREFTWSGAILNKKLYANLAKELIEAKKIAESRGEKFNIIAHSWGAVATLEVLSALNIKVDNLVTISSPATSFVDKPKGVENWSNYISPIDAASWPSLGTNANQKLILGIHLFDFENPFVAKRVGREISGANNKLEREK